MPRLRQRLKDTPKRLLGYVGGLFPITRETVGYVEDGWGVAFHKAAEGGPVPLQVAPHERLVGLDHAVLLCHAARSHQIARLEG